MHTYNFSIPNPCSVLCLQKTHAPVGPPVTAEWQWTSCQTVVPKPSPHLIISSTVFMFFVAKRKTAPSHPFQGHILHWVTMFFSLIWSKIKLLLGFCSLMILTLPFFLFFFLISEVLETELSVSCLLGKCSTTEVYHGPFLFFLLLFCDRCLAEVLRLASNFPWSCLN